MVPVFIVIWALGGWLLLICCALIWAERIRVYRRLPACAGCGYSMVGLEEADPCPECGAAKRVLLEVRGTPAHSAARYWLWTVPMLIAFSASVLLPIGLGIGGVASLLLLLMLSLMFGGYAALVSSFARMLPPGAVVRMAVIGALTMLAGLGWFTAIATEHSLAHDAALLLMVPAVVWPFSGFGVAAALALVPAEAWVREKVARARANDRAHL